MAQLHIRYESQSIDVDLADADIGDLSTEQQVRDAAARHLTNVLGYEVPANKFNNFAIDRNRETGDLTLRPNAIFG